MPLKPYIHQVQAALEKVEGTDANPTGSDSLLALTPQYSSEQEFQDRDAARFSMDREFDNVGRSIDKLSFGLDLRGSGQVTLGVAATGYDVPTREPRMGRLLRACSMRGSNMNLVYVTGAPAGMSVYTLIFGSRSGAVGRLLTHNFSTDSWLNLERLNNIPFQAGEQLRQDNPTSGASAGTVATGGDTITIETPMGWFYRPVSQRIETLDLDDSAPTGEYNGTLSNWKFSDGRYGSYLAILSNGLRNVLLKGTVIQGGTSGATAEVLENAIGQTLTISALTSALPVGTTITGGTSTATAVVTRTYPIGSTMIAVVRTSATNFAAAEALNGTGSTPNPTVSDVGFSTILCKPLTGTFRAGETLLNTADPAAPTVRFIEQTLNLVAGLTTGLGTGVTVTGATSTATGITTAAYLSGATQIVVRRNSALDFTTGEAITGTGSSPNPTIASKAHSLYRTPQDGYIIRGQTSNAEGVVRTARTGNYKVPIPLATPSVVGLVQTPVYAETSQSKLYFEPTFGTFIAGEVLTDVGGTAIKELAPTLNASVFQDHSITLYSNKHGRLRSMVGARGNAKVSLAAGQPGKVMFDFTGRASKNENAPVVTSPDYSDTPNVIRGENILTYLNTPVSSVEIDLGNTISERDDLLSPNGLLSTVITDRRPKLTADPEAALIGSINWLTNMRSPTSGDRAKHERYMEAQRPIGQKWVFYAPNAQLKQASDGERSGIWTEQLNFDLKRYEALGDDSLYFAFY